MRIRRLTPIACCLACVAPAEAAWSPPERLGRPAHFPHLAMARDGHALLTASGSRGSQLVTLPPGGMEPLARQTLTDRPWFLTYGRRSTIGFRSSAGAVFGSILDPFARAEPIPGVDDLAVNPRGDAVAMWGERQGRHLLTRYSVRPRGGRFSKPRTVAVARGYSLSWGTMKSGEIGHAVAIDGDGTVTVALRHESGRYASRRREVRVVTIPRGRRPGPQQSLGPHTGFATIGLRVAANGRTLIAWKTSDGGEEVNMPTEVWATTRRPGARRFRRAQKLEANGSAPIVTSGYFNLAVGAEGDAVVAWSASARCSRRYPVEVASAPAGERFGRPQRLAADGVHVDVAVGAGGRAAVAWAATDGEDAQSGVQVFAALRPDARARFGPGEPVSPPEGAENPTVAYDPTTGQPLIAWSATPGAPRGFVEGSGGVPAQRSLSFARFVP